MWAGTTPGHRGVMTTISSRPATDHVVRLRAAVPVLVSVAVLLAGLVGIAVLVDEIVDLASWAMAGH